MNRKFGISRTIALASILAGVGLTVTSAPASAAEENFGWCEHSLLSPSVFQFSLQYDKQPDGSKAVTGYSWAISPTWWTIGKKEATDNGPFDPPTQNPGYVTYRESFGDQNNVRMTLKSDTGETLDTWKSDDNVRVGPGHVDRSVTVPPGTQVQLEGWVALDRSGGAVDYKCSAKTGLV